MPAKTDQISRNFLIKKRSAFWALQRTDLLEEFFGLESKRLPRLVGD